MHGSEPQSGWKALDPILAAHAIDARIQIHHAAQLATALGISYLARQPDDSHTNLEWLPAVGALASNEVHGIAAVRVAVRLSPFALLVLDDGETTATLDLDGRTIDAAAAWIRDALHVRGLDGSAYTLARHYTITDHAVAHGSAFRVDARSFAEIAAWFADAAIALNDLASRTAGASTVRCWPHHFDIATLITLAPGRTVGAGMEPGDVYYAEPYYYVNAYPAPAANATLGALDGGGRWHTSEWTGAVLPASSVRGDDQRDQIARFLDSAVAACTSLVRAAPAR